MKKLLATTALLLAFASQAQAYDKSAVAIGVGASEVFGDENQGVEVNAEYRSAAFYDSLSWMAGVEADTNSSAYVYAGLLYDLALTDNWSITPSVGAGLYHKGAGKDLGGTFEFKDTIEVNYKITPDSRVGLALSHKSSAGINDKNPGTETLQVVYSQSLN